MNNPQTQEQLDKVIDTLRGKAFIIKYYTDWCNPCKMYSPVLKQVSEELEIPLINVNIEQIPNDIVKSVPTIKIIDSTGLKETYLVGLKNRNDLIKAIKGIMNE